MRFYKSINLILLNIILLTLFFVFFQNSIYTGHATVENVPSNVSVLKYFSISSSESLAEGISFGVVSYLPAINVNGTGNYNGTFNDTQYSILVSADGNTNVDFCIKANSNLINSDSDILLIGNESYSNSSSSNASNPNVLNEVGLTLNYFKSGRSISPGGSNYYRFFLDVPTGQPAGDYNNTLYFKGVQTENIC